MSSRLVIRQVRHLSTTVGAAANATTAAAVSSTGTSENPSTISISKAKSLLKNVFDPDRAIEIYSSVAPPKNASAAFSRYTQQYTVRRLAKVHRFSDIETFLESHKKDSKITQEHFLSSIIRSYGIAGMFDHALKTYNQMDDLGTPRSNVSFNALLSACNSSKKFSQVPELFDDLPKRYEFLPNTYSYGNLIKAYCEMGSPDLAMERLKEMEENDIEITAVICSPIVNAFYKKGMVEEAENLWNEMVKRGCLDVGAYNMKIHQIYGGNPETVKGLIEEVKRAGLKPDTITYNYLMTSYCVNGMMDEALKVYEDLEVNCCKPNAATYRTLVFHLCKKQMFERAHKIYKQSMMVNKIPDFNTLKHLVEGLVKMSREQQARGVIKTVKKKFPPNVVKAWEKLQIELGLDSVDVNCKVDLEET
ncbi:OLC1v1010811C1 [Oldenlandia corymbosa var. corymbosa]|uniref:OLC1v1010811C1 n=1 Tax=Oldenlandia corymbosa var. corymbosa TaxID=529605 RepID=A0AAV1DUK3_OLDCO|nr:OLC1v1010811C1 [Oldenlandia corymbosa var. corymbosa]